MEKDFKIMTVKLEDYVIKIARHKADLYFKGNLSNYINWLVCTNNSKLIKKNLKVKEEEIDKEKPRMIPDTSKSAMFNSVCEFCKKEIYPGDEICQAEGCKNYIHKCCAKAD